MRVPFLLLGILCFTFSKAQTPGAALNFDGINDYVGIPESPVLKPSLGITIEAWVKPTNIHAYPYSEIYRKEDGNARHLLSFQDYGKTLSFGLEVAGVYSELDVPIVAYTYENTWVHIAATFDGTAKKIYKNGTLIGTQNVTGTIGTYSFAPAFIGSYSGLSEFFNGSIDEVRLWSRALSQCEIQSGMSCELAMPQPGLIVYYKFNQGIAGGNNAGTSVLVGTGNSGTNVLNGTMNNFALSGPVSNWVSPSAVTTGTTCNTTCLRLFSFPPTSGKPYTPITIKGQGFIMPSASDPMPNLVSFGGVQADSSAVLSDSVLIAWVGSGASGKIKVQNSNGMDTINGFTYTPVPPITNPQWNYVGAPGFSANKASFVSGAISTGNIPYVSFVDATGKSVVMKFENNVWNKLGPDVSDGKSSNTKLVLDTGNIPIVAYVDSTNANRITIKKYNGSGWSNLSAPIAAGASITMAIDGGNNLYLALVEAGKINVHRYDGTVWNTYLNIGQSMWGGTSDEIAITTNKQGNMPYVIYPDYNANGKATVKRLNGNTWETVGSPGFTLGDWGAFYPNIKIDNNGIPIVSVQDDDGYSRISSFKFVNGAWSPIGIRYSKGYSYYVSMSLDNQNNPYVAYINASYNKQGTVLSFKNNKWDSVGTVGFVPANMLEKAALMHDTAGVPVIVFSDINNGNRASMMILNKYCYNTVIGWTGGVNNDWNTAGNWGCGVVPGPTTDVILSSGTIQVTSNVTVKSLKVEPGVNLVIGQGVAVTILQ